MGLFAKRALRDPLRTLEGNQVVKKDPEASQTSNRDNECRIPKKDSAQTNKATEVKSKAAITVYDEKIPACLRSFCPDPKGGYWDRDLTNDKKRKRKSTVRLFESVTETQAQAIDELEPPFYSPQKSSKPPPNGPQESFLPKASGRDLSDEKKRKRTKPIRLIDTITADLAKKAQAQNEKKEAKPAFCIPRKPRPSANPPNGPARESFLPKKQPPSMANPALATAIETTAKKMASIIGPNKPVAISLEPVNRSSQVLLSQPPRSSSFSSYHQPPLIEWRTTSLPMEDRKKKRKKKKKKKIRKRKVKLEEQVANQRLTESFRASAQAAEDFMNTEEGSRFRSKSDDENGPVIFL